MPTDNVEIVKRAYEAFNEEGSTGTLPFLHEDVVWDESALPARKPGVLRGHEGILELARQNAELWLEIRAEVEEIVDAGNDRVLAFLRAVGRGRFTGEEVVLPLSHVWVLREGKGVSVTLYLDPLRAREAAGLEGETA
jgi:ketosteroid isomerase-like protein